MLEYGIVGAIIIGIAVIMIGLYKLLGRELAESRREIRESGE